MSVGHLQRKTNETCMEHPGRVPFARGALAECGELCWCVVFLWAIGYAWRPRGTNKVSVKHDMDLDGLSFAVERRGRELQCVDTT